MSTATEVGSLAAPGKKQQHVSLQTIGGSSLLANGFVTLLLVIGYAVVGGDTLIFLVAGAVGSA